MNDPLTSTSQSSREARIQVGGTMLTFDMALSRIRSSANWFWWIAGLSVANSIAVFAKLHYAMLLGLGVTQIADGIAMGAIEATTGSAAAAVKVVYLLTVLGAAAFFYLMGVKARGLRLWAFQLGMIAYALDGMIFVLARDWVAAGFHGFVLFMLLGGYSIAKRVVAEHPAVAAGMAA